jgi:hypothetical protein
MSDASQDEAKRDGYERCVEAMQHAARAWMAAHPFAELSFLPFEHDVAREAGKKVEPHERVAVIAALPDVIDRWAGNADTKAFLLAMEEASHGEATYLQARAIVDLAQQAAIERSQGRMPEGHWACVSCHQETTGYTMLDGKKPAPAAGDLNVCGFCGALQQVGADGARFEALPARELNALPKPVRKRLLALRNAIQEQLARERARS